MPSLATFTVEEYEHLVLIGAFQEPHRRRIELVHGELVEMSPLGSGHVEALVWLTDWSYTSPGIQDRQIRVQAPIRLPGSDSEPEPDLVWAGAGDYREQHPGPAEVRLVVEVADTSLEFDLREKARLYAEAGIVDYWVVDLIDRRVHVFRQPTADGYAESSRHTSGEPFAPLVAPDARLDPAVLFNER